MRIDISSITLDSDFIITSKDLNLSSKCSYYDANYIVRIYIDNHKEKNLYMANVFFDEDSLIWRNSSPIRVSFIDTNSTVPYDFIINTFKDSEKQNIPHEPYINIHDRIWDGFNYSGGIRLISVNEVFAKSISYIDRMFKENLAIFTTEKEAKDYIKEIKTQGKLKELTASLYNVNRQIDSLECQKKNLIDSIEKLKAKSNK